MTDPTPGLDAATFRAETVAAEAQPAATLAVETFAVGREAPWDALAAGFGVPLHTLLAANLPRTASGHAAARLPTVPAVAPLVPDGQRVQVVLYVPVAPAEALVAASLPPWKR